MEMATCATTINLPVDRKWCDVPPVPAPEADFKTGDASRDVARRAGITPKRTVVRIATTAVKPSVRASVPKFS
jgi:hypothetical protein